MATACVQSGVRESISGAGTLVSPGPGHLAFQVPRGGVGAPIVRALLGVRSSTLPAVFRRYICAHPGEDARALDASLSAEQGSLRAEYGADCAFSNRDRRPLPVAESVTSTDCRQLSRGSD